VADEGAGLAAGEEDRIFEKFYRGAGRTAQVGVGLGLTICRIIVQAHGGRITARNRREGGAEFSFTIPQPEAPPRLVPEETQPGQLP
jgi:two-component system sensor histidine kinase KdpD